MAGFPLPIDPSDPQFKWVRTFMGPDSVRSHLAQSIKYLWMTLPADARTVMELESRARVAMAEVIEAWRAMDHTERMQASQATISPTEAEPAAGGETDMVAAGEYSKSSPESQLPDFGRIFGPDFLKQMLRQAIGFAQHLLPPGRQDDAEVERVVRQLFDECLATWWADARLFDFPTR
jgi:hypothetical protein